MADDYYFNSRKPKRGNNEPYDYNNDTEFEDIYSDSYRDPNYIPQDTPQYRSYEPSQRTSGSRQPQRYEDVTSSHSARQTNARAARAKQNGRDYSNYNNLNSGNSQKPKGKKKPKKKRHGVRKAIIALLLVFVFLYLGVTKLVFAKMDYDPSQHEKNQYMSSSSKKSSSRVENILLLGVDAREGETVSRSDTMMLVSIDKKNNKIKLTSFLRDSYVEIPGYGHNKLNAACTYGGVQLVIDTIEYNYKINIDKYMCVNFSAFTQLIDAIGGVDVEVTEKEANYLNRTWYKWSLTGNQLHFDSGESVHLDGEQALMFCRIRKLDSDVMRTDRQRRVISAVKNQVTDIKPSEISDILSNVLPNITTDLRDYQTTNLAIGALLFYIHYDIEQMSIPYTGTWHDESISGVGDALVFDIDQNANIVKNFIYYDQSPDGSASSAS